MLVGSQIVGTFDKSFYHFDNTKSKENQYVKMIDSISKLHLLTPDTVKKAYSEKKEVGLFHLFMKRCFIVDTICTWTNDNTLKQGVSTPKATKKEILAVVGLELAASLIGYNRIKDLWKKDIFCGHPDFIATLGRDCFLMLHSKLQLVPTN